MHGTSESPERDIPVLSDGLFTFIHFTLDIFFKQVFYILFMYMWLCGQYVYGCWRLEVGIRASGVTCSHELPHVGSGS